MASLNPYLFFNGNCEEAFHFYQQIFGGEFQHVGRFSEMPPQYDIPESDSQRIMHITFPIGETTVLMGADIISSHTSDFVVGNNSSISVAVDSKEEADHLFTGLSEGAKITMPLTHTFWGSYFGTLTDKFGIQWMVSFGG